MGRSNIKNLMISERTRRSLILSRQAGQWAAAVLDGSTGQLGLLRLPDHLRRLCIRDISGDISSFLTDVTIPSLISSSPFHSNADAGMKVLYRDLSHKLFLDCSISRFPRWMFESPWSFKFFGFLDQQKNPRGLHLEGCGSWKQWLGGYY